MRWPTPNPAHTRSLAACVLSLSLAWCPLGTATAEDDAVDRDFVQQKIIPLLEARCFTCHGPEEIREEEHPAGGLLLTSRDAMMRGGDTGPAIIPGDPEQSLLMKAVDWEELEMPPDTKMPAQETELFARWIQAGAPWFGPADPEEQTIKEPFPLEARRAEHWCWAPLQSQPIPSVVDADWCRNSIDYFLADARDRQGLSPAPDADRRTLARRIYFAIVGLPPTPAEVDAFVSHPADDDQAIEALVKRLLDSEHFGERWGRHWLDLVRYAESRGHEYDFDTPNPWHYRDYVIRSLNADLPFDEFFIEHVAGDLLNEPRTHADHHGNESILATGFWYLGDWIHSPTDIRADEMERIDNQLDVFGRAFLGLTIACARCHDHKFDAISAEDYYALAGYLQSSSYRQVRFDTMLHNQKIAEAIWTLREQTSQEAKETLRRNWDAHRDAIRREIVAGFMTPEDSSDPVSWTKILYDAKNDSSHPLFLLAAAAARPPENRIRYWKKQFAEMDPIDETVNKIVFDYREDASLRQDGFAFGRRARRPGELSFSDEHGEPQLHVSIEPAASHDLRWPALALARGTQKDQGFLEDLDRPGQTLKTDTFEIDGAVHCLARGKGTLQMVVASHRMINGPLHNDLVQKFDTEGKWKWISFDLSRYTGERAHLEFVPEAGAVLDLQALATGPTPPRLQPLGERVALASNTAEPESFQKLAEAYADMTVRGIEAALFGTQRQNGRLTAEYALADWALQHPHIAEGLSEPARDLLLHHGEREDALLEQVRTHSRTALAIWDGDAEDENILIRGSSKNPGTIVPRRNITALRHNRSADAKAGSGRLELAHQLADPKLNPLLSRVIVNRVWHHIFGRGIVGSVDNFGYLGTRPTHPELLDHLALEFVEEGWSLKQLIEKMITSRTFRQQSTPHDHQVAQKDPENNYLAHMSLRRLEGEAIRDSILAVSGRLDRKVGGRSIPIHLTKFTSGRGRPASGPLDGNGRRSIYLSVRRNFLSPWMLVFDTPIPLGPVGRRNQSNVPAQPLALLNDPFVLEQARLWAEKTLADPSPDGGPLTEESIISRLYEDAFARRPRPAEIARGKAFITHLAKERGIQPGDRAESIDLWAEYAHVLLNTKEFIFLP
ncbi:MAG: PSD1 and planctomycete cytochrome C domain-containing protein [Planctomycetota bacterium]|nr:PSD1 and planctomycete cytochrome C domain-containing protein [Planctomycetota bacterium]